MEEQELLFSFGPFVIDPAERVLRRGAAAVDLKPKDVDVLLVLLEQAGGLLRKERLFERVWGSVRVEECNLSQHVAALRRALGDDARAPTYIETVPRCGYRFLAPVARAARPAPTPVPTPPAPPPPPAPAPPEPGPPARSPRPLRRAAAALGLAAALGIAAYAVARHAPAPQRVAVLPVSNFTGQPRYGALCTKLAQTLSRHLATLPGIEVTAAPDHVPAAAGRPAAAAFVELSLLSVDDRVRVVAELIDASGERLRWADVLEADPVALPELEERVARTVSEQVAALSAPEPRPPLGAHAAAQREEEVGRAYCRRATPQVLGECLEHLGEAVRLDPEDARARAGLAEAYLLAAEARVLPAGQSVELAEASARRAGALDPGLAEAHAALGAVAAARWDFAQAEASLRRAIAIEPSLEVGHRRLAAILTLQDRHAEAVAEARMARDLDPMAPAANVALAAAYHHAGQAEAAIEQALATLRLAPHLPAAYDVLGRAHLAAGHGAEALAALAEAVRLSDRGPAYVATLAGLRAQTGAPGPARELLFEVEHPPPGRASSPLDVAAVHAALGERDRAFAALRQAVDEGVPWLLPADAGQALTALHDDARFGALVQELQARHRLARDAPLAAERGPR
ncbi:MAG: winged helix-turn-helix domain-containing protein [Anaeromyxobacter sp.]